MRNSEENINPYGALFHLSVEYSREEERELQALARQIPQSSTPETHRQALGVLKDAAREKGMELSHTDAIALLGEPVYVDTTDDFMGRVARVASERLLDDIPKEPEKKLSIEETSTQHEDPKGEQYD